MYDDVITAGVPQKSIIAAILYCMYDTINQQICDDNINTDIIYYT